MTPQQILALVKRFQAAGLLFPGEGTVSEWGRNFAGTDPRAAWETASRLIETVERGPITIAMFRRALATTTEGVPKHLACPQHPGEFEYKCPHCARPTGAASPDVMAEVKRIAAQAAADARARDLERAADLQRRADESAARTAEKLERKRQLATYHQPSPTAGAFSSQEDS